MQLLPRDPIVFQFDPKEREAWKRGELIDEWFGKYPFLFDSDNWRNAKHATYAERAQHEYGYHYAEWYSAIQLYKRYKLLSLVGKYTFPSHRWKWAALHMIVKRQRDRDVIMSKKRPDLLVYTKNYSQYCLVEVKGPGDRLSAGQIRDFKDIADTLKVGVHYVHLKACTEVDPEHCVVIP
jgi:hypothetical protein